MPAKTSKEQFEKAKESASKVGVCVKEVGKNLCKLLLEGAKTAIYGLDGTDKWIGSKIETKNKLMNVMKNHLLKLALVGGMLVYPWPHACNTPNLPSKPQKSENHLAYGIDVSHFNNFDIQKLSEENELFRNDADSLTNPKEFIIFRASQWEGKVLNGERVDEGLNDEKFAEYFSKLNAYNQACDDTNEQIRFATYHLYVPSHNTQKQADNYWNTLVGVLWEEKVKNHTPILDIEMEDIKKSEDTKQLLNDFLECCQAVEKKFGKKPLIYTSNSAVKDFFRNDERFTSYQYWVASYGNNTITPEDIQKEGSNVLDNNKDTTIHQFTQHGKVAGTGTQKEKETDINVVKRKNLNTFTTL